MWNGFKKIFAFVLFLIAALIPFMGIIIYDNNRILFNEMGPSALIASCILTAIVLITGGICILISEYD